MNIIYLFFMVAVLSLLALSFFVWGKTKSLKVKQARGKLLDERLAEELAIEISEHIHWRDESAFQGLSIWFVKYEKVLMEGVSQISMEKLLSSNPTKLRLYQAWAFERDSRKLEKDRLNGNIDKWVAEAIESSSEQE